MNKTIKIIITVSVFTLIVLYFLRACDGRTIVHGTDCEKFNSVLLTKTEEYFMNNLPLTDGDMKVATVDDLISENYLTLSDLSKVGTSCTGNVFVGKSGINYYYSSDVVCGTCSTGGLYKEWSDYQDTLPNLINKNSQVQVGMFYNYGTGQLKFSDWSDWALTLDAIKEPQIPEGASIVDTEKEEKTQYSYREGSYKWYKLTQPSLEYYGNGKYYETIPAPGYTKDTQTKKVSRTEVSQSKSELTSKLTGLEYSPITTTPGYILQTPEYIYSYVKSTQTCSKYKPLVKCYKSTTITVNCYTFDADAVISACQNKSNCKIFSCTKLLCPNSNWTLVGNSCHSTTYIKYRCSQGTLISNYCHLTGRPKGSCPSGWSEVPYNSFLVTCRILADPYCTAGTYSAIGKYCFTSVSGQEVSYGYTYDKKTYYNDGGTVVQGSCPSGYTEESTGKNSSTCATYSTTNTTYYLKKDGTEVTDLSKAEYISETDFAKLGKTSYSKDTSKVKYTPAATYKEGNCPSGTNSSNCSAISLYKADVYSYKWYKTSSAEKTWYNNGEYLAKSPGSGYQADTATAKWGNWSEFSDKEVKASSMVEVKTQILKRIRKSYLIFDKLYFPEFLPLDEFEKQVGKTLAELSKDTKITIVKKIMYKYRTLK